MPGVQGGLARPSARPALWTNRSIWLQRGCDDLQICSRTRGSPFASFPTSHNRLFVTQHTLFIDITAVVTRRGHDLPGRIVAGQTTLPSLPLVRDGRRQVHNPGNRPCPALWSVAEAALTRQMVVRSIVTAFAGVLRTRLVICVAASARCGLVVAHQGDRVIGQPSILEAGRRVAILAVRAVVGVIG
jgi:hypothetical protein